MNVDDFELLGSDNSLPCGTLNSSSNATVSRYQLELCHKRVCVPKRLGSQGWKWHAAIDRLGAAHIIGCQNAQMCVCEDA